MKKHTCCAILSSAYSLDDQICSLNKDGNRTVECFVSGEKFEFNNVYEERDDYMDFYDSILKPYIEKFISGNNVSIITNYSYMHKANSVENFKEYNVFENV